MMSRISGIIIGFMIFFALLYCYFMASIFTKKTMRRRVY